MIRIHNTETDEIIDREMNDQEFAILEEHRAREALILAKEQKMVEDKIALLEKLGITAEEAALLLS